MSALNWQKSSFSSTDGNTNCLELAAAPTGALRLRESTDPHTVISASTTALRALLGWAKGRASG